MNRLLLLSYPLDLLQHMAAADSLPAQREVPPAPIPKIDLAAMSEQFKRKPKPKRMPWDRNRRARS